MFKLADRAIAERRFSEWSMAFQAVSPTEFEQLVGYVTPRQLTQQLPDLGAADSPFLTCMRDLVADTSAGEASGAALPVEG